MIKLYQFPPVWGLPNASGFCLKLETYLRMAKLPYESVYVNNPSKSPKGKLPYIIDQGKKIADSSLIINYLKDNYGDILDNHLTSKQQALGLTIQRLLEEHLYWVIIFTRFISTEGWPIVYKTFFQSAPKPLRPILAKRTRQTMRQTLHAQGLGRHSKEEIYKMGKDDIYAVNQLLGENYFILGDQPTSYDACVFAFIVNVLHNPIDYPVKHYALSLPNLNRYCLRMKERFYKV